MESVQYFKTMSAFCTQRAKMDGEDAPYWLEEAELLAKLAIVIQRQKEIDAGLVRPEKSFP